MTTPLTSDEIREWALIKFKSIPMVFNQFPLNDWQGGYRGAMEDLIMYIDSEPILRSLTKDN